MLNKVKPAIGRKSINSIFLFAICYLLSGICYAQFQPDLRLTNNTFLSITSISNAWSVASIGSIVHVVWFDDRDGNNEIYYKRSTDGGVTFGADTRLTNNTAISDNSSVAVSGSALHVVWVDFRDGNSELYYKRSTDAGVTFGPDTRLTNNTAVSHFPSVAVSGSVVHAVWVDERDGINGELYYKRSTDAGVTFGADIRLTNNSASTFIPSIAVSGSVVHIAWVDARDGNNEIYYKRSTDGGATFGPDTRLTNNTASSLFPSIAVSGSIVHIVWYDERDNIDGEIYYKRSTDGGVTFGSDTRLTNNTAVSSNPSVAVSGSVVHLVWFDARDGNNEIYYKRSTNAGVTFGTDTRLTKNTANSQRPSVAVSGSAVHVVWTDDRDGNFEVYYKRDPTGNVVGITNTNSEIPEKFSLSQNYPNPFNPATKIQFALTKSTFVKIVVYDMLGKEIETIINGQLNAGTYETDFDGSKFASGVYYYTLTTDYINQTKRMVLIK